MKKSGKTTSLRAVMDSQIDFEREARRCVAVGIRKGWVSRGCKTDHLRQIVEAARRKGWIK